MISDLIKAKDRVEDILSKHVITRDCDKTLWLSYLVIYHDLRSILGEEAYQKFKGILMDKDTVTMESIRRMRQKFQEDGKYVGKKRLEKLAEANNVKHMLKL